MESTANAPFVIDNIKDTKGRRCIIKSNNGGSACSLNVIPLQHNLNKRKTKQEGQCELELGLKKSVSTESINVVDELAKKPAIKNAQPLLSIEDCNNHSQKKRNKGFWNFRTKNNSTKLSSICLPNIKTTFIAKWVCGSLGSTSRSQIPSENEDDGRSYYESTNFCDNGKSDSISFAYQRYYDINLGFTEHETDLWSLCIGKDILGKLEKTEIKRQEHIYEFILTEKHHCLTLLIMEKVYVYGLQKYCHLKGYLEKMFPRLTDLLEVHLELFSKLRQRQKKAAVVSSIADIILEQFSNNYAAKITSAYGEFCCKHRGAVDIYKYYFQNDTQFIEFVRQCQPNTLFKKKDIPECLLLVIQRLAKYPLLIGSLIKVSKGNSQEQEDLQKSLKLVEDILRKVDSQVAEKEKEDRKLEIYNKIDARSFTVYNGIKFNKFDILEENRTLKFEGVATLVQRRGKTELVLMVVLLDILFFLQEKSLRYSFITPDNKDGVVSLDGLLVIETHDTKYMNKSRGIYLVSCNHDFSQILELTIHKPKDVQIWIKSIRDAVKNNPKAEKDKNVLNSKGKDLFGLLSQKDIEKLRLLAVAGIDSSSFPLRYFVSENSDEIQVRKEVLNAAQQLSQIATSLYRTGLNLSASVTFGDFYNSSDYKLKENIMQTSEETSAASFSTNIDYLKCGDTKLFDRLSYRNHNISAKSSLLHESTPSLNQNPSASLDVPKHLSLFRDLQNVAVQLSHYAYTLFHIISHFMTSNKRLDAQTIAMGVGKSQNKESQLTQDLSDEEVTEVEEEMAGPKSLGE